MMLSPSFPYPIWCQSSSVTNGMYGCSSLRALENTAVIIGNIISVLLVGSAFIAVGVFMSCLTENQLVAAVTTIAAIALFLVIGMYSSGIGFAPLRAVLDFLSVFNRFTYFTYGVIDWSALIYYASISFVFLFLPVRVYERRRWA